jgi:hypothetical protein
MPDRAITTEEVERRHQENQERFGRLERRMDLLFDRFDEADRKRDEAREEIKARDQYLAEIMVDLRQAIQLFRGAKLTARLVGWAAGIAGAGVAVWQFFWPKK